MKRIIGFFTGNWGLKILALVLAIVVFYSMKDTTQSSESPAFLKGPADGGK